MKTPIYAGIFQSDLNATGYKIFGLPVPSATDEAATKGYVDAHSGGGALPEGWVSVMDYGAHADGVTDDTAAVQTAIATATSVVYFPPGHYFFSGSIGAIPVGISLVGATQFGPRWSVYDTTSTAVPPVFDGASVLYLTANAGNGAGPKFISATSNTTIIGLTFYWPNQVSSNATPIAYPWAIHIHNGNSSSVRYCEFVNAYQGIYLQDTTNTNLIEEIRGEILYRGIKLEGQTSVTRLRGCYFDDQWSRGSTIATYRKNNAITFDCGRNDETILESCFCYDYMTWLHCYDDSAGGGTYPGPPWLQVRGGGADLCNGYCVWIEQTQAQGVSLEGVNLTTTGGAATVKIDSTNSGSVRISNSIMLSLYIGNFGLVDGSGEVTVDNCYCFADLNGGTNPFVTGTTGWAVTGTGNFALRGCTFRTTQTHVSLGSSLTRAVVTGNLCSDTFVVSNSMATGAAVIYGNTGQGATRIITNSALTTQGPGFASDTYLAGSNIVVAAGDFKAGGQYRCLFDMTKGNAGFATPIISLRIGTTGTTSDAALLTFTFGAGTGVIDSGVFEVVVTWRTVGSGTTATVAGWSRGQHNLATTGLFNNANTWFIFPSLSAGFNSSTATTIGLSFNGGASFNGVTGNAQATLMQ